MATYIVDGYNLLHRVFPGRIRRDGLEGAREFLESRLRHFLSRHGRDCHIEVVYDGEAGGHAAPGSGSGLRVRFSRPPATADDVILDLCRRHEGPRGSLVVVTSDLTDIVRRLQGLPCRHLSSEQFATLMGRAEGTAKGGLETAERPSPPAGAEVDEWLREFGLHPEDDEW